MLGGVFGLISKNGYIRTMTDRFEKLNPDYANEHAKNSAQADQNRFGSLNPERRIESQYARDAQRAGFFNNFNVTGLYWIVSLIVIALLPLAVYVNIILPMQANKMLTDLAYTKPEDISKLAGSMKLCKTELYTDDMDIPKKGMALEVLQKQTYRSSGSSTANWEFIGNSPDVLKLSSSDKNVKVSVLTKDLDWSFLETHYNGVGKKMDVAAFPEKWAQVIAGNPSSIYKLSGLPAQHKITLVGLVVKESESFYFKPFAFKHLSHGVIATSSTREQLNEKLSDDVTVRDIRSQMMQKF